MQQGGLPAAYRKVDYLQSNGTQYFWTDVYIQDGLTVDSVQTAVSQDSYLFGGVSTGGGRTCFNGVYSTGVQGSYPTTYYNIYNTITYNTVYHIITTHKDGRRTITVNDRIVSNYVSGNAIADTQEKCVCFGARKQDGSVYQYYKGKLYSLKVLKDDTLLADYIPCIRKSDSKPGMYDTVSKTFYTNAGTGEFSIPT